MATKTISQLTAASAVDNGDLFEVAHPDGLGGYTSNKEALSDIAAHINGVVNYSSLNTTSKTTTGAINEILGTLLTGTLAAGNTSLTLQNAAITTSSTVDIYTDVFGVSPINVVTTTGQIVLTFEAQVSAINVKVRLT